MSTSATDNGNQQQQEKREPLLALPASAEETVQQIGMNDKFKLKELGPVGKYCYYPATKA